MTWWALKKDRIVNKTAVATFWVAFGNIWAPFLAQQLVTLPRSRVVLIPN